ncbi:hypothetical protein WR25_03554 [Diploscapter pachys]|uniref:Uncharacterized protein n=1 Tax=Diploscapter pachys TaxID=2018661 RepID=A0A2A2K4L0_9BILA|nr:hypothetical protein WR25_03554 [Diploscapter pachys]
MDFNTFTWMPSKNDIYVKKQEKLPFQKPIRQYSQIQRPMFVMPRPPPIQFPSLADMEQPGAPPRMSGHIEPVPIQPYPPRFPRPNLHEGERAVSNPASVYLEGADFDKIPPPRCSVSTCQGPVPHDGSFSLQSIHTHRSASACTEAIIPLNMDCLGNKGYPIGMICTVCCDCTNELQQEMRKTFGYRNYRP